MSRGGCVCSAYVDLNLIRAAEARCEVLETAGQGLWTTVQFGSRGTNECVRNAESDIETPIQSEAS